MGFEDKLILAGAACLMGAMLVFWLGYRRCARRYDAITTVPRIDTRDIPGLGAALVEVSGDVRADTPLISDLARMPCVIFRSCVTEHWTTTHTERDKDGKTRTVTRHHSATRYSNEGQIDFRVHDATGHVIVRPAGASIDLLDGLANLDGPVPESPAYHITPTHFGGRLSYDESVLPLGQEVYVLGQVGEDHAIQQPADFDRPFIISYRTEEQLIHSALWGKRIGAAAALVLLVAGLGLLLEGLERSPGMAPGPGRSVTLPAEAPAPVESVTLPAEAP